MADIATIGTILTSIKTASDIAKLIKDSGSSLEQAEFKLKFAELISALADAKIELADLQSELIDKEEVISTLRKQLDTKQTLKWDKPYYWLIENDEKIGPFCQQCYDTSEKLVRLQNGGTDPWICNTCKCSYKDANYVAYRPRKIR